MWQRPEKEVQSNLGAVCCAGNVEQQSNNSNYKMGIISKYFHLDG